MASEGAGEPQGGSPIGNLLCGSWELAQKILENLSFYEVAKLRLVCRTWADVGEMILAKRRPLHYLTTHPHCIPTTLGKVALAETSAVSLFDGFFSHIVSKPRYCLAFCNANWLSRTDVFETTDKSGKKVPLTLAEYLHKALPPSCELGVILATGIIGTVETAYQGNWLERAQTLNQEIFDFLEGAEDEDATQGQPSKRIRRENENRNKEEAEKKTKKMLKPWKSNVGYSIEVEQYSPFMLEADAVSILTIPYHPGVRVNFFNISSQKFYSDFRGGRASAKKNLVISEKEFNEMLSLSANEHMTALLLFETCYDNDFTNGFVKAALNREDYKVALGGGVADAFQTGRSGKFAPVTDQIFGVAVSGPNIMAASVVIPENVDNPRHLGRYMKMLKSCEFPERQSVAFMFTCCGRGHSSWQPIPNFNYENVESKAFRKVFPNTPIFGFFGRGELGITYLPRFPEGEETAPVKRKKKPFHQFSTIIVLLSFL
ncbi:uncharacterized protein LOC126991933 [Eriocheir sinensis]|uniref:uncharacterized protein LOC126991933 n=1 Tax=Eriocheir sinensis TaxID=95602 RepID=UPI0021C6EB6C|nr:uncharacterized protein LOC126991933 [Eriocheir sinensis]